MGLQLAKEGKKKQRDTEPVDNAHGDTKSLGSLLLHLHLFSQMRVRAVNAFAAVISGFRMF